MIINIDIREYVAELNARAQRHPYRDLLSGFGANEWRSILTYEVRSEVRHLCHWFTQEVNDETVREIDRLMCYMNSNRSGQMYAQADRIHRDLIDDITVELTNALSPYIHEGSIWQTHGSMDSVSVTYVGNGRILEEAIRASGGNFQAFLQQFF